MSKATSADMAPPDTLETLAKWPGYMSFTLSVVGFNIFKKLERRNERWPDCCSILNFVRLCRAECTRYAMYLYCPILDIYGLLYNLILTSKQQLFDIIDYPLWDVGFIWDLRRKCPNEAWRLINFKIYSINIIITLQHNEIRLSFIIQPLNTVKLYCHTYVDI